MTEGSKQEQEEVTAEKAKAILKGKEDKGKEEATKFFNDLLDYYQLSIGGVIGSIDKIAEIQKNYPEQYQIFKNLSRDTNLILQLGKKLSDTQKTILFELLIKSASLSERINILTELTYREKKILSKDMKEFSEELIEKIKELKK